jgi:hypothetical protein
MSLTEIAYTGSEYPEGELLGGLGLDDLNWGPEVYCESPCPFCFLCQVLGLMSVEWAILQSAVCPTSAFVSTALICVLLCLHFISVDCC